MSLGRDAVPVFTTIMLATAMGPAADRNREAAEVGQDVLNHPAGGPTPGRRSVTRCAPTRPAAQRHRMLTS
jgi:hypothetical protein